jgi:glycine oxidase
MASQHCVVLGAGLMGRLMAWALSEQGHEVQVHEAQAASVQGSAAWVAAAMLAPLAESAITELNVVKMGAYGLTRWPSLLARLQKKVYFQQLGTLVVWHRQDLPEANRFASKLGETRKHLPELEAPVSLDRQALQALEPSLAESFQQGLFLPGEAQLDNRQLLDALMHQLNNPLVSLHYSSAVSPAQFTQADWVIDCRGVGARSDWNHLRGVRGEVVRVHAPEVQLSRPLRLIHPRYPLYIAPKQDGVFVIGATEIESDDTSPASVRSSLELLSAAYSVHKGFAEARILEISAQVRPTLADNLPAIRLEGGQHHIHINGLYRHGFLIAPALLDAALGLMAGNHELAQSLGIRVMQGIQA